MKELTTWKEDEIYQDLSIGEKIKIEDIMLTISCMKKE